MSPLPRPTRQPQTPPAATGRVRTARKAQESGGVPPVAPDASSVARIGCLRFIAPLPVSTNNAYATVNGRRVKTHAARAFSKCVAERAVVAKTLAGGVPYPPFALYLGVWWPDEGRRDLSNTIKLLEDALMNAIGSDDRHVHLLVVRRQGVDRLHPRVDVELREKREPLDMAPAGSETTP